MYITPTVIKVRRAIEKIDRRLYKEKSIGISNPRYQ
tara:strand:- start:74 stop:181 length:108 start_codon:yes stop_codon:yes gene_type:complete